MKSFAIVLAAAFNLAAFIPHQVSADTPRNPEARVIGSIHVGGVIEVDAHGRVEQVGLRESPLRQRVEASVLQAMQRWTFEPFELEGTAQRIRTSVYVRIDQVQSSAGYQLVFGEIEFGQPLIAARTAPRYPSSSLRDGISAEVLMQLTLDDAGSVSLAEPVTAKVLNRQLVSEDHHRRLLAPFVRASLAATQKWRFDFVEPRRDGERHQMLVPIVFTIFGRATADAEGDPSKTQPVMFELSSPLGRSIEALAREVEGRTGGLSISPAPSPLKLRSASDDSLEM
jgi:TonB family protein